MVTGFQITCANKNLNGTIVRVGGPGWSLSQREAIQKIIGNELRLHIFIGDDTFEIGVRGEVMTLIWYSNQKQKPFMKLRDLLAANFCIFTTELQIRHSTQQCANGNLTF